VAVHSDAPEQVTTAAFLEDVCDCWVGQHVGRYQGLKVGKTRVLDVWSSQSEQTMQVARFRCALHREEEVRLDQNSV
jgi:hypothetical protein